MLEEEKVKKLTMIHGEVDSGSYQSQKSLYSGNSSSNVDYLVDRVLATHYRKQKAKDRLPWRKILSAMLALFVVLAAIPYILPPLYGDFSSDIIVSLDPNGVRVNETLFVNMSIPSSYNITSVSVDIAGIDSVSLELVDNITGLHLWSGFWLVHDVFPGEHVMTISAWDDVNGSYFADIRLTVLPDEEPVSNESLPPDIDDGNVTDNETIPPDVDDTNVTDNESIVSVGLNLSLSSDKFVYNVNESVMLSGVVTFNYSLINTSVELLVISIDFNLSEIVNVSDGRFVYEFVPVVAGDYTVFANLSYSNESVEESLLLFVEGVPVENVSENVTDNVTRISIVDAKKDERVYALPGTSFYIERTINGSIGMDVVFAPMFSDALTLKKIEVLSDDTSIEDRLQASQDVSPRMFTAGNAVSNVEQKIDVLRESLPAKVKQLNHVSYSQLFNLDGPVTIRVWFEAPSWEEIISSSKHSSGYISYLVFSDDASDFEASTWWNSNWDYRKLITINSSQVNADLTNFPILVYNSSDSDLAAHAQSDGDDIAFVLYSDNTTQLNHEIENYTASGQIVAWINVTSISSSSDTKIWMYYNNSGCSSQENVAGTWDSNYTGVWHLAEDQAGIGNTDLYQDSSSNNNDGDDNVSATGKDGQINGGQQFDGIDDYVDLDSHIGDYASLSEGSISLWFNFTNNTNTKLLFSASCNTDASSNLDIMYYQPDNELMVGIREDGGSVWIANHPANYSDGSWHHYVLAVDSSGNSHYVNGTNVTCSYPYGGSASTQAFFDSVTGLNTLRFGNREDSGGNEYHFDGFIDEVRISNTARNSSWINTSYNTISSPDTFLSFESKEQLDSPTVVTNESTGVEETNATLHGYLFSDGNESCTVRFEWGTTISYCSNTTNQTKSEGKVFSAGISGLTPGQLYHYRAYANNTLDSDTGDDLTFLTKPQAPTSLTAQANNSDTIYLTWMSGTGANNTYIERNASGVSVWARGVGTMIYNGSGTGSEDSGLSEGITYYYQAWSYTVWDSLNQWSDTNISASNKTNYKPTIGLIAPTNGSTDMSIQPLCQIWANDTDGDTLNVYWYENSTNGWTLRNTNSSVSANSTVNYTFTQFDDYGTIYYWKVAVNDSKDNTSAWFYFTTEPLDTVIDLISPYNITSSPKTITATNNTPVDNVTLWYHYSTDNISWDSWMDNVTLTSTPWQWSFTFSNGTGYYEFYSIGKKTDSSDETPPNSADATCNKINNKPTHTTPILNSTYGTNSTNENLTCYNQSTSDLDGDPVKNIFNWYKNSSSIMSLNMPFEGGSSSTYTKDYSGQGHDGTVSGATWNKTVGYDGRGAYQFDGIDDYIHGIPNSTINRNKGSIEVWAKPNSFATPQHLVWAGGSSENGYSDSEGQELHLSIQHFNTSLGVNGFTFFYGDNEDGIPSLIPGGNHTWLFSGNLTSNIWYHVVVTWDFDNNITKMYVNGTLVDSDDLTSDDLPYNTSAWQDEMHIGRSGLAQRYYNGTLDEVKIYNFSLTPEQVLALSQNKTNIIVSQETSVNDVWQCEITPNDGYQDGITRQSNNLTIIDISVDITPSLWDIGTTTIGNYNYSTLNGYFNLTNNGSTSLNIQIKASNATNTTTGAQWNLTSTPGHNNYSLQYNKSGGGTWTNINLTYDTFVTTLGISSWQIFDLNIFMATTSTKSDPLSVTITFRSVVI